MFVCNPKKVAFQNELLRNDRKMSVLQLTVVIWGRFGAYPVRDLQHVLEKQKTAGLSLNCCHVAI